MKPVIAVGAIIGFVLSILYICLKYIQTLEMLVGDSMNDKLSIALLNTTVIIRGCHNRDNGTVENESLRNPKFIFFLPKERKTGIPERQNCRSKRNSTMGVR